MDHAAAWATSAGCRQVVLLVVLRRGALRREALGLEVLEVVFDSGLRRGRCRHLAILEDLPRSYRRGRHLLHLHLRRG